MDATSMTANCALALGPTAIASIAAASAVQTMDLRGADIVIARSDGPYRRRVAGEKGPEPVACLAAVALHERLHALQLRCAAGDDLQLGFEAAQIQLRDEAVVALL